MYFLIGIIIMVSFAASLSRLEKYIDDRIDSAIKSHEYDNH